MSLIIGNVVSIIFIVLFLTTVEQLSIDIYLPSMPAMGTYFQASDSLVQMTLSIYMVGFALSPLIAGPLTDRFGRKRMLIIGLCGLLLTALLCVLSSTIGSLLLWRALMGCCCGFLVVANQSMVRDCFDGPRLVKVASYMSMAWSAVPIIAPAIGGYIQQYWHWQGNFIIIACYVLIGLVFVIFGVKESMLTAAKPLRPKFWWAKYYNLLRNRNFMLYLGCTAVPFALTTAFITAAPFLIQDALGYSPVTFGWIAFIVAFGYLIGTFINNILLNYYPGERLIRIGILLQCIFSLVGLILGLAGMLDLFSITLPMVFLIMSEGLVYPNAAALTFEPIVRNIGFASALYISLQLLTCAISSAVVSKLPEHNQIPLMVFMCVVTFSLALIYFSQNLKKKIIS